MQEIYLDNAATSFPKASGMGTAMARYVEEIGVNVARGGYATALAVSDTVLTLRERLCALFGSDCVEGCILTSGATFGLNMVLKGFLHTGDHVLVSNLEHNAVMRPLHQLQGIEIERLPCLRDGAINPDDLRALLRPSTRLVCMTHASNVCGTLLPIAQVGAQCHELDIAFVVDASQTVGHLPIRMADMHIDALVFSAHKGLLGPQGIGAALLTRALAQALSPFVTGGTGSRSDLEEQPVFLPDKLEAGTPNLPGIYGFLAALDFLEPRMQSLWAHEYALGERFLAGLDGTSGVRLIGTRDMNKRVGVFSLDFIGKDNADIALRLEQEYGIMTRCGLHCAPAAHRALGTFPQGTVRFSLGFANTEAQIDTAILAVRALAR